jgi:hypothetical protein
LPLGRVLDDKLISVILYGTVSKASEKRIFRDLLSRLIDQIEEPAPGFA